MQILYHKLIFEVFKPFLQDPLPVNLCAGDGAVVETDERSVGCSPTIFTLAELNETFLSLVVAVEKVGKALGCVEAG